jgi:hypothetical protein
MGVEYFITAWTFARNGKRVFKDTIDEARIVADAFLMDFDGIPNSAVQIYRSGDGMTKLISFWRSERIRTGASPCLDTYGWEKVYG